MGAPAEEKAIVGISPGGQLHVSPDGAKAGGDAAKQAEMAVLATEVAQSLVRAADGNGDPVLPRHALHGVMVSAGTGEGAGGPDGRGVVRFGLRVVGLASVLGGCLCGAWGAGAFLPLTCDTELCG